MPATIAGSHLGPDIHANRPAANAAGQPIGALYSCTTHGLIYKTDGSTWSTYANLGATASGSITASGYTQATAKILGRSTASTGAIEEIAVGSGLSLSAGTLSATGGGAALSTLGYPTIGGSTESMTSNRWLCKKVTSPGVGVILNVGAYVVGDGANNQGNLNVAVFENNAGAPGKVIAWNHVITNSELLTEAALGTPVARWLYMPINCPTTAADFWIAVQRSGGTSTVTITYDGSGSDQYFTAGGAWVADPGGSLYALTTSSNKYSIRATFLG